MLLIMIRNMASISTQVYTAKVRTYIQFLSSFAAYSAIYISQHPQLWGANLPLEV